jgi:uncharacterized Zn-finger protein
MSASSLSHLLQTNGATEPRPGLQASAQNRGQNAADDGLSYSQVQASPSSLPLPSVTSTSLNFMSVPSGGTHLHLTASAPAPTPTPANQSHLMTSSLYQCADCKKRYSRPEHLARHIQTHTLGKRFFCQVCGKAFARADLLKRHTANHENDGDGTKKRRRIDASPGSGRVSHACRSCAAARVKCEEIKPCQRCQKKGVTCEFAATEVGSAAAMHLLHLSADAHNNSNTPGTSSQASQHTSSPNTSHIQGSTSLGTRLPTDHEGHDILSNMDDKAEQGQLPTPDAVVEQGRC